MGASHETNGQRSKTKINPTKIGIDHETQISKLDYIEVPQHEWYHSKVSNELYHFDNGLYRAHTNSTDELYFTDSTL